MYFKQIKPFIDQIIAAILLVLLSPILITLVVILWLSRTDSIFFVQMRPGLNGELFPLYKFRSMQDLYDYNGNPLPDQQRITRIGKFLRSTSLDELPQLINVLRGEMSLVGPRPLLSEYLEFYNANHLRRTEVKPGITGLAQINGRDAISWTTRLDLDVKYVENISFSLDVSIIFTTLLKLFSLRDINAVDSNSTAKFSGYH